MTRWFLSGCILCVFCLLGGCAGGKAKPVPVSGTVNLDGKQLTEGSITLIGEGGGVPETFPVKDGKFEGQATPGKKRVEVRAFRPGKPTKMGDTEIPATQENFLPARFNTKTTLTAEVTSSGVNPNKFDVTSQ